jgi:tetratricopeptide (TPR) repeat protein
LAWNKGEAEVLGDLDDIAAPSGKIPKSRKKGKSIDLRAHLLSMDKEALVAIVLEQAMGDDALRDRLNLSAAVANPDGVDLVSLRQRIDKALEPPEFDYDSRYWDEEDPYEGYVDQIKPVLSALKTLLGAGQAASVATLVEYALAELNKQCMEMEYDFVESEEIIHPLIALHVRACIVTKPDPQTLADWLFRLGVRDAANDFEGFAWEKYKPVLGKSGLARFRQLAEEEWKKIPALKTRDGTDSHRLLRSRLQEIVMQFAREDGDIDAEAEAAKKDLSQSGGYLVVARIYQSAKRYDEALEWAEKGWKAFPDKYGRNPELRDLLAREYRRKRRNAEAMDLYWSEFTARPSLARYQELKKQTDKDKAWPSWRAKAFERMREAIAAAKKKKRNDRRTRDDGWTPHYYDIDHGDDHSLLVEILLWEKKPEEAWREAMAGNCAEDWWLKLSAWRENKHPEDCIPIWRRRVERLTQHANQGNYAPAAESLAKLGELMARTGESKEFTAYMRAIRDDLHRRRNFIAELDKRKLP